jgi:hypothetical protein
MNTGLDVHCSFSIAYLCISLPIIVYRMAALRGDS